MHLHHQPRDYPKYNGKEIMGCEPLPLSTAIAILREGAGSHFDPDVVNCFIGCILDILELYKKTHFSEKYIEEFLRSLDSCPL